VLTVAALTRDRLEIVPSSVIDTELVGRSIPDDWNTATLRHSRIGNLDTVNMKKD